MPWSGKWSPPLSPFCCAHNCTFMHI
jgi:hypothetical protein